MINNNIFTLGCQVWGNLLSTDINLVKAWCHHYSKINYIDKIIIKINYNQERQKDVQYFKNIFLDIFNDKVDIILTDSIYSSSGKVDSMKNFHNNNLKYTNIYIPRDIDEFIDFNILTEDIVEYFINQNNIPAIMGKTRDRIKVDKNHQLILSDVDPTMPIEKQFTITQQNYNIRLRSVLRKVIMIKNTHTLTGGGAHCYYDPYHKKKYFPKPLNISIPVDHYCWLKSSVYNRQNRPNSNSRGYRKINNSINKYFIVDLIDHYSRTIE